MSTTIEVRNLTKRYGTVVALDRVNLDIQTGEFLVLLGPSGCGKTTLLRCLAGLERPDEGEIRIAGKTVYSADKGLSAAPGKRQVGMVFQSYALWPHMKVNENIGFGLRVQKVPRQEADHRIETVLRDLAMEGLGERYPSELSGGQQQRVALARLLATRPQVFLMDEPLSNLDARLRMDMRSELKRLHHESGATTVYVTHDQTEAMTMAGLVVVMEDGRLQQVAPPNEVYRHPANTFVADFIGMPRINLLEARAIQENGQPLIEIGDFRFPVAWAPADAAVTIAARPEDVTLLLSPEAGAVEFQVYAVLPSGPEEIVQVRRGSTMLIARESRQLNLQMDQKIWIKFDPVAINLFDDKTGRLLTAPASTTAITPKPAARSQA